SCPVFATWLLLSLWNGSLVSVVQRLRGRFAMAGAFLCVLFVNVLLRNGPYSHQFVAGFINGAASMTIMGYYAVRRPDLLPTMRWLVAVVFGLAILPSLPLMYADPWAARFLSSSTAWDQELAHPELMLHGVGTYSQYTGLAVVMAALIAGMFENGPARRLALLGAIAVMAASVVLAMFTMASVLLLAAVVSSSIAMPFLFKHRYRWLAVGVAAAMLVALPAAIDLLYENSEAVQLVYDKFFRLVEGVSEMGFQQGDESSRAEMFLCTCETFLDYPLLGVGLDAGRGSDRFIGGHSSLVDHWAMFGILGYAPFFLLQANFTRIAIRNWLARRNDVVAWGSAFAWGAYWVASVGNPTAFSIFPFLMIFTDCHRSKRATGAMECGRAPLEHRPHSVTRSAIPQWVGR
ncbi:MAG: O-antigen ligase family protein, partial [Planctomycetaceae bacterium]|nr:O-antigen ligase family protein [Planctomycetaceae bacterium]